MGVMLVNANLLAYAVPSMVNTFLFKDSGSREISIFTSALFPLVLFLKKHTFFRMDQLIDICVVDRLNSSKRFQVIYVLFSSLFQFRVLVHVFVGEDAFLPSLSSLFSNALWLEREVWDTFGLFFAGHADLRRILTDYGFNGHPFRKNFPLVGYCELRYDDERMHIVYGPVELSQNYRYFRFIIPWDNFNV